MEPDLELETLDRDGALAEAFGRLHGQTRGDLLRGALVGGGALLAACAAPARAASPTGRDTSILNFALTLEELQAAFYTEVERNKVLRGELKRQADTVGGHERAHVRAFRDVLGAKAIKRPHFDFGGATEGSDAFRRTAVAFEDLAVAAYKGQAPHIHSRDVPRLGAGHPLGRGAPRRLDPAAGRQATGRRPLRRAGLARDGDADRRAHALRGP